MSDVVLFRPSEYYSKAIANIRPPLGLLHLAGALRQAGFSVTVIDTATCDDWQTALTEAMTDRTLLAGVGVMTGFQIRGALDFAAAVRRHGSATVVFGGLHPSLLPEQTLAHDLVDVVVRGEGESVIVALAAALRDTTPLGDIPGIGFKAGGQTVLTDMPADVLEMDRLPAADYSLTDVEYYAGAREQFAAGFTRCLDLNTDRGCPFRCGFCYNLNFNRGTWRAMTASNVLDAAEAMIRRYGLESVNFVADNFFVRKDRVADICRGLIDRGLSVRWHSDMRIDTFLKYPDDLLQLMIDAGCRELTFGIESGSPRVLEQIRKDITVEQVRQAHRRARQSGFGVSYHFMAGFPDETRPDLRQTLKLILHLTRDRSVTLLGPSIYIPYPGTPLFDRCVEKGYQPPQRLEDWIDCDWEATSKLPWFTRGYRRHLDTAKFLAEMAATRRTGPAARCVRIWARARLRTFVWGLDRLPLDVWLLRALRNALRR